MQDENILCGFVSKSDSIFVLVRGEDWFTVILANAGLKPGLSLQTVSPRAAVHEG